MNPEINVGKILARSIIEHKLQTYIPQILTPNAQKTVLPKQITQVFRDFYASLYNLPTPLSSQSTIDEYIPKLRSRRNQMPQYVVSSSLC